MTRYTWSMWSVLSGLLAQLVRPYSTQSSWPICSICSGHLICPNCLVHSSHQLARATYVCCLVRLFGLPNLFIPIGPSLSLSFPSLGHPNLLATKDGQIELMTFFLWERLHILSRMSSLPPFLMS